MIYNENQQTKNCLRLKEVMDEKGVRVRDMAIRLGVGDATVTNWRSGRNLPKADMLPQIAQVLGVSLSDLYY